MNEEEMMIQDINENCYELYSEEYVEQLQQENKDLEELQTDKENYKYQLDIANKKLDKIKELVNKYGYYTLSEIPDILSIIDGSDE